MIMTGSALCYLCLDDREDKVGETSHWAVVRVLEELEREEAP